MVVRDFGRLPALSVRASLIVEIASVFAWVTDFSSDLCALIALQAPYFRMRILAAWSDSKLPVDILMELGRHYAIVFVRCKPCTFRTIFEQSAARPLPSGSSLSHNLCGSTWRVCRNPKFRRFFLGPRRTCCSHRRLSFIMLRVYALRSEAPVGGCFPRCMLKANSEIAVRRNICAHTGCPLIAYDFSVRKHTAHEVVSFFWAARLGVRSLYQAGKKASDHALRDGERPRRRNRRARTVRAGAHSVAGLHRKQIRIAMAHYAPPEDRR